MTATDDIKAQIDIVDLIAESVALQRSGQTFKARCPFHAEKTPSFVVDPRRQTWRCFGACAEGGDIFSWVMKRESVEFREALSRLAQRAGIRLQPRSPEAEARDEARKRLLAANEAALIWWRQLLNAQEGQTAREHLAQRGLGSDSIERFGIGVAPSEPDGLIRHLGARGFRSEDLEQAGLIVMTEQGPRDRFRDRLMFPIRSTRGDCVGFGGRTLIDEPAKYVNTPESPLFEKRSLLYGLNLARDAIRSAGHVIVVEGYTDVISAHEHGTPQTVASMGTSLTDAQVRLLKPLTRDIRFALDADTAGQAATRRGIETARAGMGAEPRVAIDPRGLIRQQDELAADIRIIELPEGRDPDDLIRSDPHVWTQLVDDAPPFLDWLFERGRETHDLDDARGRSNFVRELAPLVQAIADPVVRGEYLQRLAAYGRVEVGALPRGADRPREPRSGEPPTERRRRRVSDAAQEYLLRIAVSRSEAASELAALAGDPAALIDDAEDQTILVARLEQPNNTDWAETLPDETQERIAELRSGAEQLPPLTIEEARAAAREVCDRLDRRRTRESVRLQAQNLARDEEAYGRTTVAEAAATYIAGRADELNEEISEAAARVVQARNDALSLHHRPEQHGRQERQERDAEPNGGARDDELVRPAAKGSRQ